MDAFCERLYEFFFFLFLVSWLTIPLIVSTRQHTGSSEPTWQGFGGQPVRVGALPRRPDEHRASRDHRVPGIRGREGVATEKADVLALTEHISDDERKWRKLAASSIRRSRTQTDGDERHEADNGDPS